MWVSRRRKDGTWGIVSLRTGRYATDDDGNVITFRTKAEAEKERRERGRGVTGVPRDPADVYRERYLTGRLRRR